MVGESKRVCTSLKVLKKHKIILDVIGVEITLSFDLMIWLSQYLILSLVYTKGGIWVHSLGISNIHRAHMSCLYALIFLSNFDHTHSFTLSPTWLFYVHSWCDFMPCDIPVLDCLIYFSHLSIWGHHKKGENGLSWGSFVGSFEIFSFLINWYICLHFKLDTSLGICFFSCVSVLHGLSLDCTPWWEKRWDSWRFEEQTMKSYSFVSFQF